MSKITNFDILGMLIKGSEPLQYNKETQICHKNTLIKYRCSGGYFNIY